MKEKRLPLITVVRYYIQYEVRKTTRGLAIGAYYINWYCAQRHHDAYILR